MSNISKEAIAKTLALLEKYKQSLIDFDVSSAEKEMESRNAQSAAKFNIERNALLLAEQVRELDALLDECVQFLNTLDESDYRYVEGSQMWEDLSEMQKKIKQARGK